jgi:tetratricopeptide (TPR) repeat protein
MTWSRHRGRLLVLLAAATARRRFHAAVRASRSGDLDRAVKLARRAAADLTRLQSQPLGPDWREVVVALHLLADIQRQRVQLQDATATLDQLNALLAAAPFGADRDALLARTLIRRGDTRRLQADYEAAEVDLRAAVPLARDPLDRVAALNALGIMFKDTGRLTPAAEHYAAALTVLETKFGSDHPAAADILHNLAGLAHARGHYTEGEPHIRRALELRRASGQGRDLEASVLSDRGVLAALLAGQGRLDEARALFEELAAAWTALCGPDHYEVAFCEHHLAVLAEQQGDANNALIHTRRALTAKRTILGPDHPEVRQLEDRLRQASTKDVQT